MKDTGSQNSTGSAVDREKAEASMAAIPGPVLVHPFRPDAPIRKPYGRGSEASLDRIEEDEQALADITGAELARTTIPPVNARWAWWTRRCMARGWDPYNITPRHLSIAGALLLKGKYRSGKAYLSEIRKRFIENGGRWTQQLELRQKNLNRGLGRGLGPARQPDGIPLELLLDASYEHLSSLQKSVWPAAGIAVITICCAWLLRELESSGAALADVTLHEGSGGSCGWVEWNLPASKTDPTARGATRSLRCACPSTLCPAKAMRTVVTISELVRQALSPVPEAENHPLICTDEGQAMTKEQMVTFYREIAKASGIWNLRITGHSCRITGAQRMALAGHPVWTIQVFGRWGSAAVLGYVREALLGHQGGELAQRTEAAASSRTSVKNLRAIAGEMLRKCASPRTIPQVAEEALTSIILEHLADTQFESGPGATEIVEAEVRLKANTVWAFSEQELKLGRARTLRNSRGRLHIKFDKERCLCGWTWAGQQVTYPKREGPVVGDTTGWCARCHAWALAIAGSD